VKKGFTLVELLVVVLIIGILASMAMPHYEKAVWQSRNAQLKSAVRAIADAQKMHLLKTGKVAKSLRALPVTLPLEVKATNAGVNSNVCNLMTPKGEAVLEGKNFIVVLNTVNSPTGDDWAGIAVWTEGRYKCNGFAWWLHSTKDQGMMCLESRNKGITTQKGEFCEELESATWSDLYRSWDRFTMI